MSQNINPGEGNVPPDVAHNSIGYHKGCETNGIGILFMTCGHLACCYECAKKHHECPMCGEVVTKHLKVYPGDPSPHADEEIESSSVNQAEGLQCNQAQDDDEVQTSEETAEVENQTATVNGTESNILLAAVMPASIVEEKQVDSHTMDPKLARLLGDCPLLCGNPVERFLFSINERGDYVCGHGICSQCHSTLTPKLTEDPLECPFCRAPVRSFMVPILYEG